VAEAEQQCAELHWTEWAAALGVDLDETARQAGALQRRREVKCGLDLLRLILVYCVCDWSLRLVGAWFFLAQLGALSDVAVLKRLRQSTPWLGHLLVARLQQRQVQFPQSPGVRLRLRDATVISQPGSHGTDWRVHLSLDLGRLCLDGIEVTDAHGAETLARFPAQPGEIQIADRGYAFASSLGPVLAAASQLIVRINWHNLPLVAATSRRWQLGPWLKRVRRPQEQAVWLTTPQGRFPLRLVAWPLPAAEAEKARHRTRQAARKKGHTPSPYTLCAAGFVLLLTNLPAATWRTAQVAALYRVRWQIELEIKRLKSLLRLDGLRAQEPRLVQTYLLGKLLAALLVEDLTQASAARCPTWFASVARPVSVWRLTHLWGEQLRRLLQGPMPLARVWACLPALQRYLCGPPRRRLQQLAAAKTLYASFFTW
jgi:hypothetical protein